MAALEEHDDDGEEKEEEEQYYNNNNNNNNKVVVYHIGLQQAAINDSLTDLDNTKQQYRQPSNSLKCCIYRVAQNKIPHWLLRYCILSPGVFYFEPPCIYDTE